MRTEGGISRILEYDLAAHAERVISPPTVNAYSRLDVSPDDKQIVFVRAAGTSPDPPGMDQTCLSTVDLATGSLRDVNCITGVYVDPSYSPSGAEFLVSVSGFESADVGLLAKDGSAYRSVACCFQPRFFPDGQSILAQVSEYYGPAGTFKSSLTSQEYTRLPIPPNSGLEIAPDGGRVVLVDIDSQGQPRLNVLDLTTGQRRAVTTGSMPAWQPAYPYPVILLPGIMGSALAN